MADQYRKEEEYIISESPEISLGEYFIWIEKLGNLFPALKSRNYQLYFFGQLISLIGTWLQIVAQGWLVLQLTNSAFAIGLIAAIGTLPSLLFSLFGGVIVDRFPKKRILLFTQTAEMILAFLLGILTILNRVTVPEIGIIAFLMGVVTALDIPARQAFAVEMVGKDALASAIALNSGIFNAARVIGPSVAGILIALIGTGGAFIVNGISFIAVLIALLFIRVPLGFEKKNLHPLLAIKEGIHYSFSHPIIRTLLIFTAVVSIFGWSFSTIMPIIAKNTFHLNAEGLGYLYASTGLGALGATFLVSALAKKVSPLVFIIGGDVAFSVSLFLFTFTHSFLLAMVLLFLAGLGLLSQFATINTTIQHMVEDELRGRVMSIYVLMFIGLSPLGNFQIGFLAERFGADFAIRLGTVIIFLFGILLFLRRNKIKEAYRNYRHQT